jgi:hypothetical protein
VNERITQAVLCLPAIDKDHTLHTLLEDVCDVAGKPKSVAKTLIFINVKAKIQDVYESLRDKGFPVKVRYMT